MVNVQEINITVNERNMPTIKASKISGPMRKWGGSGVTYDLKTDGGWITIDVSPENEVESLKKRIAALEAKE